jgi:hypothetical protein
MCPLLVQLLQQQAGSCRKPCCSTCTLQATAAWPEHMPLLHPAEPTAARLGTAQLRLLVLHRCNAARLLPLPTYCHPHLAASPTGLVCRCGRCGRGDRGGRNGTVGGSGRGLVMAAGTQRCCILPVLALWCHRSALGTAATLCAWPEPARAAGIEPQQMHRPICKTNRSMGGQGSMWVVCEGGGGGGQGGSSSEHV